MNRILIDIRGKAAKTRVMCRLARLKTTEHIQDCGEYYFPDATGWHKIILTTSRTEAEVENWLYKLNITPRLDWEYSTLAI